MGKALIIRDVNFSANAIDTIPLDGKLHLVPDNAIDIKTGYISSGKWKTDTTGTYAFYSLKAGELFVAKNQSGKKLAVAFITSVPSVNNEDVTYAIGSAVQDYSASNFTKSAVSVLSDVDCIVAIQENTDGGVNCFPAEAYIMKEYNIDYPRVFTESNYDFYDLDHYYSSGKQWTYGGTPTDGKPTSVFYNVNKGETVHIEAKENTSTVYAIFNQSSVPTGSSTVERQSVAAGGSVDIEITSHLKKIWIFRADGSTNKFPISFNATETVNV